MDTKLPDTLSALLRVALADLDVVEKTPGYNIDMSSWHRPVRGIEGPKCRVCLAGAMLVTRGAPKDEDLGPECLPAYANDPVFACKMYVINRLRNGDVYGAYRELQRALSCHRVILDAFPTRETLDSLQREIPQYHYDSDVFKAALRTLADDLEREGL